MAKKLVLAVAGAGKTSSIINALSSDRRSLILTYTNENLRSLHGSIVKKFGYVPRGITVMSYFSFLYVFCFRPFFSYALNDNSYTWELPLSGPGAPGKSSLRHYMTKKRYMYSNRVAKYIIENGGIPKIISRIEKHFDDLFIDEVQDFAASDFNLILEICAANINMLFVGDFFQHTFDTSRDGAIRMNLHKGGVDRFASEFQRVGCEVDNESLSKTYRCSPTICRFITEKLGIYIESSREDATAIHLVDDPILAERLFFDDTKVKLFYKESHRYACRANNWGRCKGLNSYHDVCVVLNQTTYRLFYSSRLTELAESTRNKLYVACSRARGDLFILDEAHLLKFKH